MKSFTFYLCARSGQTQAAGRWHMPLAHMAWQVGASGRLTAHSVGQSMRGGLLMLGDAGYDGGEGDGKRLMHDILHELADRGMTGIVCDFEQRRQPYLAELIEQLAPTLERRGLTLYVPECYARRGGSERVMISTALTQGNLGAVLEQAVSQFGARRLALEIECLRLDMTLPSPQGTGRRLEPERLDALLKERGGQSFYSGELHARYFTYRTEGEHHFVMYDEAGTLRQKARTAAMLGIGEGFILYPEAERYLSDLAGDM